MGQEANSFFSPQLSFYWSLFPKNIYLSFLSMEESNGWRVVKVSQTISKALLCFLLIWFCSNNEEKQAFRSKHFFEGTLGVENSPLFQQVMDKTRLKHIKTQNNKKHFRNPPRWGQSTLNRIHGWGNIALLSMQFLARLGWISQPTPPTPSLTTLRLKSPLYWGLKFNPPPVLFNLNPNLQNPPDLVITVCNRASETCPRFPAKTKVAEILVLDFGERHSHNADHFKSTRWNMLKCYSQNIVTSDSYLPSFLATISFFSGGGLEFWGSCSGNRLWGRGPVIIIFCLFGRAGKNI